MRVLMAVAAAALLSGCATTGFGRQPEPTVTAPGVKASDVNAWQAAKLMAIALDTARAVVSDDATPVAVVKGVLAAELAATAWTKFRLSAAGASTVETAALDGAVEPAGAGLTPGVVDFFLRTVPSLGNLQFARGQLDLEARAYIAGEGAPFGKTQLQDAAVELSSASTAFRVAALARIARGQ